MNKKQIRGFTLIELLVVIAIIGILSTVVLSSLNSARAKARDTQRIAGVRQIQTALSLYYNKYGHYPASGQCGATTPGGAWSNSVQCLAGGRWLRDSTTNLAGMIPSDPTDPLNQNNWPRGAYYYYSPSADLNRQWYMIVYGLEKFPNALVEGSDGVTTPSGTYYHYGSGVNGVITVGVGK